MGRLEGKFAIVAEAAQGIGAALAKGMEAEYAQFLAVDIGDTSDCANAIREIGGIAAKTLADFANYEELAAMASFAEKNFEPIDILANNAGIFTSRERKPF